MPLDNDYPAVSDWTQTFTSRHVDSDVEDGEFISGESIVVAALQDDGNPQSPAEYIAIGLLETGQLRQDKQIQQLFELGSALPYFVPGHTMISMSLNRVMFNGESLLRVLYGDRSATGINPAPGAQLSLHDDRQVGFYVNLASTFFNSPTTLGFFMCDNNNNFVGGFGLEGCYVQSHVLAFSSRQVVIAENVAIRATKLIGFSTAVPSGT